MFPLAGEKSFRSNTLASLRIYQSSHRTSRLNIGKAAPALCVRPAGPSRSPESHPEVRHLRQTALSTQPDRFSVAGRAQRIVGVRKKVLEIERREMVAVLMHLEATPITLDLAPLGILAVVAWDKPADHRDAGISGAGGSLLVELRLQFSKQKILAPIGGGIGVPNLSTVNEGGLDDATLRACDSREVEVVVGTQGVGVPNA